jgi:flavin reductase (DIM6/NTAB) family NADH-FMN oxidoreductase RutF
VTETEFKSFEWRDFEENLSKKLAEEWMLISPGRPGRWNTMTASWGGFGHVWNMDAAFVFVRPSRHSYGFMEKEEGFTLSFFDKEQRRILEVCGACSGRDEDKAALAGLTPRGFAAAVGAPERLGFEEARLVLSCRKLYAQDLDPGSFVDGAILPRQYARGDLHRLYVGAIEAAWRRE